MSVVYFGSPSLAVAPLKAMVGAGIEVLAAITQPDKPKGRGMKLSPPPVKEAAQGLGIRVIQPDSLKSIDAQAALQALGAEFFVVVAYGKLLPKAVLDMPAIAPVNLHASLLPAYRGAAPINWAIIDGLAETGLTTMLMNEGLDEGDILLQQRMSIGPEETAGELSVRMSESGGPLIIQTLRGLKDGSIKPAPQSGVASYARLLSKDDGRVNWSDSARRIYDLYRGITPWPGAFTFHDGKRVKITKMARPMDIASGGPGVVIGLEGADLLVGSADGVLQLREMQPEGKRPMSAADFARGYNIAKGTVLGHE